MTKAKTMATKSLPSIKTVGAWPKTKAPIHNSTATEPYTAPELRPYAGRPGSLDFLRWPSLAGGRLVYRGGAA